MRKMFVAFSILGFMALASAPAMAGEEVCLCHIPPGNPDNPKTLCVGEPAARTHLRHGDSLGECVTGSPEPEAESSCSDGLDDDADGMIDCQDPECAGQTGAAGQICQLIEESCDDGMDNDGDGGVDCDDSDCSSRSTCDLPEPEVCDDGLDNDGDALMDCSDPDCSSTPVCGGATTEVCNDGVDNDGDGSADCGDPECALTPACDFFFEVCDDGIDNDLDARVDCADDSCANDPACNG